MATMAAAKKQKGATAGHPRAAQGSTGADESAAAAAADDKVQRGGGGPPLMPTDTFKLDDAKHMDTDLSVDSSLSAAKRPREPVEGTTAVAARREADEPPHAAAARCLLYTSDAADDM
eukprot:475654-Prymnesium_polylepis.1